MWPVSDRATRPTEGLPYRRRPSVGGFVMASTIARQVIGSPVSASTRIAAWNCESFLAAGASVVRGFFAGACGALALVAVALFALVVLALGALAFGAFFGVVFLIAICRSLSFFWGGSGRRRDHRDTCDRHAPRTRGHCERVGAEFGNVFRGGGGFQVLADPGRGSIPPTTTATHPRPSGSGQAGLGQGRTATTVVPIQPPQPGTVSPCQDPTRA